MKCLKGKIFQWSYVSKWLLEKIVLKSSKLAASEQLCQGRSREPLILAGWSRGQIRTPPAAHIPHPTRQTRGVSLLTSCSNEGAQLLSVPYKFGWVLHLGRLWGHFTVLWSLGEFQSPADQNLDNHLLSYFAFCPDERQATGTKHSTVTLCNASLLLKSQHFVIYKILDSRVK